ncbi:MAG: hypothetical protein KUG77_13615 [Nannocystaceae bacterium]|nr:hypothetical protein [Nannocystaceae bacterium]
MKKLSTGARGLLEQYREESEIHDQPDASVLERIESSIEQPGGVAAQASPRAAAWMVWGAVAAASLATLWVWSHRAEVQVAETGGVSEALDQALGQALERAGEKRPAARRAAPHAPQAVLPTPPLADAPPVFVPRPQDNTKVVAPEVPALDDSLQRELELLRQAREALGQGRSAGAKASLRAHALSYPQGQLAEEREALLVVVRCTDGETKTGRVAFERSHPRSHHLPSIRVACDSGKTTGAVTDGAGGGQ